MTKQERIIKKKCKTREEEKDYYLRKLEKEEILITFEFSSPQLEKKGKEFNFVSIFFPHSFFLFCMSSV